MTHTNLFDLVATIKEETALSLEDGTKLLVHGGESYCIDRIGNDGAVILTPFGEATLPWRCFRWTEAESEWQETGQDLGGR